MLKNILWFCYESYESIIYDSYEFIMYESIIF